MGNQISKLLLAALLLAACTKTEVPPATSASSESPEPSSVTVCYVFISEYSGQMGGLPAAIDNLYVYKDGFLQQTQESNDDTLSSISEATVQAEGLFAKLDAGGYEIPPAPPPEITPGVLPEFTPPSVLVEYGFCDGTTAAWAGAQEKLPGLLHELIGAITDLAENAVPSPIAPGQKYLRAQIVEEGKVEEITGAGLSLEITDDQLSNNPILAEALQFPRRLIPVPVGAELYVTIPISFTPGKSAFLLVSNHLFQVRHIVSTQ